MDGKRWINFYCSALLLVVLAAVVSACSKEEDDSQLSKGVSSVVNNVPSMNFSFLGVWTVDDIVADTVGVDVCIGRDKIYETGNDVSFYGFPYQTIINLLYPGKMVVSVVSKIPPALFMRFVGLSNKALYFEFLPFGMQSLDPRVLHFMVKLDDGKIVEVSLRFVPNKSKAIIDTNGDTFSCAIPIELIAYSEREGMDADVVIMEKKPDPEMKLQFTSIQRIEGGTVGN
jgi:hypothetical protein